MKLKKTPLYEKHLQNNAKIVDFGGWALPLEYRSILGEAKFSRTGCGLFDVSHMGQILIAGKKAFGFLQYLTTNDISLISKGKLQYNLFVNEAGGIIDDCMIYNLGESFLCVVNASNKEKVLSWLIERSDGNVIVTDKSDGFALISIQGPNSEKIVSEVFLSSLAELEYMHFIEEIIDKKEVIISRSGYTAEDGFEVYLNPKDACSFWDKLLEKGKDSILPCGLGARDILRIEAGYPLYGHELDRFTNPYEATLAWAIKVNKDFIAKGKIVKVNEEGLRKKRIGFIMQERILVRKDYPIYSGSNQIGLVSSGTYSPNLNKFIGMAYIDIDYANYNSIVDIEVRGKLYKAKIVKFPFIKERVKKIIHS